MTGVTNPSPETIGRYQIRGELGRGMMGVVYRAHDPDLGRDIAIKVIQYPGGPNDPDRAGFEERFFAEARSAARLSHPGIVIVHDVGRDGPTGAPFMALQLVPGRTLEGLLRERKWLEMREALAIARRVADALHHAHGAGVVHRDIKPANIMILPSGDPMIMDFGIAKMETSRLTATGHFVGTPLYMSPEQALANPVDGRSDLFSLGSVLYESLTGVPAFAGETVTKILFQLISLEPAPPSTVVGSLSPAVDHILGRCLAKDAARRYQSARELSDDLGDLLEGQTPRSLLAPSARPTLPATPISGIETVEAPRVATPTPAQFVATATGTGPADPTRRDHLKWLIAGGGAITLGVSLWSLDPFAEPGGEGEDEPEMMAPPAGTPSPTPLPDPLATPTPVPARLILDFEHTLREGTLRVFLDDRKVIDQAISGRVTRKVLGIEFRRGRVARNLEIPPGRRMVRLEVAWDDNLRTEEIEGAFNAGARLNLRARLGSIGGLRKNLSLDWN